MLIRILSKHIYLPSRYLCVPSKHSPLTIIPSNSYAVISKQNSNKQHKTDTAKQDRDKNKQGRDRVKDEIKEDRANIYKKISKERINQDTKPINSRNIQQDQLFQRQMVSKSNNIKNLIPTDKKQLRQHEYRQQRQENFKQQKQQGKGRKNRQSLSEQFKNIRQAMRDHLTLSQFSAIAKDLAAQYTRAAHKAFNDHSHEFQLMLDTFNRYNIDNILITDYYHILDWIRMLQKLQKLHPATLEKTKKKVFGRLSLLVRDIEHMTLQQICPFFAKTIPLNPPEADRITSVLHDLLADQYDQTQSLPLSPMQLFLILHSIGKKPLLSYPDKKIIQILLLFLQEQQLNDSMVVKVAFALKNCDLSVNISNWHVLSIHQKLMQRAVDVLKTRIYREQTDNLMKFNRDADQHFVKIHTNLYHKQIEQLSKQQNLNKRQKSVDENDNKETILRHFGKLAATLFYLRAYLQFDPSHQQAVINKAIYFIQDQPTLQQRKRLDEVLLTIIKQDYFKGNFQALNDYVTHPSIDFSWPYALYYSLDKHPFPLEQLQNQLNQIPSDLKISTEYFEMAVTVAVQSALYPDHLALQKCYQNIKNSIKSIKKSNQLLKWLNEISKVASGKTQLSQAFYKLYAPCFLSLIAPSTQQLAVERALKRNDRSNVAQFWWYLVQVADIDHPSLSKLLLQIPLCMVMSLVSRGLNNKARSTQVKSALLLVICHRIKQPGYFSKTELSKIVDLMIVYSEQALIGRKQSVLDLYWQIVYQLVRQYSRLSQQGASRADFLFCQLLTRSPPRLSRSIYFHCLLTNLISSQEILSSSQSEIFTKTTIIRAALHKNLLSSLLVGQIEWNYLSQHQKSMVKSLLGKQNSNNTKNKSQLTDKYESTQLANKQSKTASKQQLLIYLKDSSAKNELQSDIFVIETIIAQSGFENVQDYLIHFALKPTSFSLRLLHKLADLYQQHFQLPSADIIGLIYSLKNTLALHDLARYQQLVQFVCQQLMTNMSCVCLADHLAILQLLPKFRLELTAYEQAIHRYALDHQHPGALFTSILLQLSQRRQNLVSEVDWCKLQLHVNWQACKFIKICLLNWSFLQSRREEFNRLLDGIVQPVQQSIYTSFLERKLQVVIPHRKNDHPVLHKPNQLCQRMINLLQTSGLQVHNLSLHGQALIQIGNNSILGFTEHLQLNQRAFLQEYLGWAYPNHEIILNKLHANLNDVGALLSRLALSNCHDSARTFNCEQITAKLTEHLET